MFCEAYKQSLMDAAASGELLPALRGHLASCESCHAVFAQEQSLYAAIDTGLRAAANPEIPSTLLPRVRVALNNAPVPQSNLQKWTIAAAVFVSTLAVAMIFEFRHREAPGAAQATTAQTPASSRSNEFHPSASAPVSQTLRQSEKAESTHSISPNVTASFSAEVLVTDEERAAFAKFLTHEQTPSTPPSAMVVLIPGAPQDLAQIPPVEIASLRVSPLEGSEANHDDF